MNAHAYIHGCMKPYKGSHFICLAFDGRFDQVHSILGLHAYIHTHMQPSMGTEIRTSLPTTFSHTCVFDNNAASTHAYTCTYMNTCIHMAVPICKKLDSLLTNVFLIWRFRVAQKLSLELQHLYIVFPRKQRFSPYQFRQHAANSPHVYGTVVHLISQQQLRRSVPPACMCVCVSLCLCAHTCVCVCVCMYMYTYVYIFMHTNTPIHASIPTYAHTCMYTSCMCTYICMCMYVNVCVYIHVCACTYVCTHTYLKHTHATYIHEYMSSFRHLLPPHIHTYISVT